MQLKVTAKKRRLSPLLAAVGRRLTNKNRTLPDIAREVRPRTYHNHTQKRPERNVKKTQTIRVHFT